MNHSVRSNTQSSMKGRMILPKKGEDSLVKNMFAKSSISEITSELLARFASNISKDIDKQTDWKCEITTPNDNKKRIFTLEYTDSWTACDFHKFFCILKHPVDKNNDTISSESIGSRASYYNVMDKYTDIHIYLEDDYNGKSFEKLGEGQTNLFLKKGFYKIHLTGLDWECFLGKKVMNGPLEIIEYYHSDTGEVVDQIIPKESYYTRMNIHTKQDRVFEINNTINIFTKDLKRFFNTHPHIKLIIDGKKQQLCKIAPTTFTEDEYRFKPTFIEMTLLLCPKVATAARGSALAGKITCIKYGGYNKDKIRNKEFLDSLKGNWINLMQEGVKKTSKCQGRKYVIKTEEKKVKDCFYFPDDCIKSKEAVQDQLKCKKEMTLTFFNSFSDTYGNNITKGLGKTSGLLTKDSFVGMYFLKNGITVNFNQPYRFDTGSCPSGNNKSCLMGSGWRGDTEETHYKNNACSTKSGKYKKSLPVLQIDQYFPYNDEESYLTVQNGKKTDTAPQNPKKADVIKSLWAIFNEHLYHLNPDYIGPGNKIKQPTKDELLKIKNVEILQLEKEKKKAEQQLEQEKRKKEEEKIKNDKLKKKLEKTTMEAAMKEEERRIKEEELKKNLEKEKKEKEQVEREKEEKENELAKKQKLLTFEKKKAKQFEEKNKEAEKKVENIKIEVVEKEKQNKKLTENLEKTKEENTVLKKDKMKIETDNAVLTCDLEKQKAENNYHNNESNLGDFELTKSHVYILTDNGKETDFKIGWSGIDKKSLLKQYGPRHHPRGTCCHAWVEVKTSKKFEKLAEKLLHNRYGRLRINNSEWFGLQDGQNIEEVVKEAKEYLEKMKDLIKPI